MVVVRIVACLSLLVGFSLQVDVKSGKEAGKAGNFMEDEQWLSTISQYSRKIKHWNRFRDVSVIILIVSPLRALERLAWFVSGDFCAQLSVALKCRYAQ